MTLATHAIFGAALASRVPDHPVVGFVLGFGSHFVLDAIPHWDYELKSSREDKANPLNRDLVIGRDFYFDLLKIAADGILGLIFGFLFFQGSPILLLAGMAGAVLPDFLQFAYFKTRWTILAWLQSFHIWIHADYKIKNRPALGVSLQILMVLLLCLVIWAI